MNLLTVSMTKPEKLWCSGYLLFELFLLPQLLQLLNRAFACPWSSAVLNFLYFLLNFLAVFTILCRFLMHNAANAVKSPGRLFGTSLFWFAVYWAANTALSWLIVSCFPDFSNVNDSSIAELMDENAILMTVGTVALVPLVEECLFRGLVFGALHERSRAAAYIVSSAIFCSIHVMPYIGTYPWPLLAICFLQYIPAGLCLARAYEKADNILAPILIHTTINAIGMIATR